MKPSITLQQETMNSRNQIHQLKQNNLKLCKMMMMLVRTDHINLTRQSIFSSLHQLSPSSGEHSSNNATMEKPDMILLLVQASNLQLTVIHTSSISWVMSCQAVSLTAPLTVHREIFSLNNLLFSLCQTLNCQQQKIVTSSNISPRLTSERKISNNYFLYFPEERTII